MTQRRQRVEIGTGAGARWAGRFGEVVSEERPFVVVLVDTLPPTRLALLREEVRFVDERAARKVAWEGVR
jgi:hypothetical protein